MSAGERGFLVVGRAAQEAGGGGGGGGEGLPDKMGGVCGPLSKTLTQFMTKVSYFPTLFITC